MRTEFKDAIRIVIFPRREGDFGFMSIGGVGTPESNARHALEEGERIMAEVRRHVDGIGQLSMAYEKRNRCSHCGNVEDSSGAGATRMWPECCTPEQQEFFAAHSTESDEWFFEHGMGDPDYLNEFREALGLNEKEEK